MIYQIETIQQARETLEYFNYFHDGFIKKLTLVSHDEFEADGSQVCTGTFDVEIEFAHYNYTKSQVPHNQIVAARFVDTCGFWLDLTKMSFEWSIQSFEIEVAERNRVLSDGTEPCFLVKLVRDVLDASRNWQKQESNLFTFKRAIFSEALATDHS
ncbi:MAG: hypothetical protein ACT4QE_17605 [Anaerolineales bacterium]